MDKLMSIEQQPIDKEQGELELRIVPLPNAFVVMINSDILRGTLIIDSSLEQSDMDEINSKIFHFIDELSMRILTDEDEIPQ